ncbi:MAG: hypothetical protein ABJA67_15700 [Chthonomonadales bacterium]
MINRIKLMFKLGLSVTACAILTACGGGGGGTPPADVTGRILVVSSGSTLAGASVAVGGTTFTTLTDGVFTLRGISSTAPSLTVTATGIKPLTLPLTGLKANSLNDLGDIYVLNATDTGTYTATASGQIVRSDTLAAVPGAKVKLSGQVTTADSTGHFAFTGLPVGLGTAIQPVGLVTATGFEDKPIQLDFPLVAPPPDNNLGQIQISPPVGGIPSGPFNIKGKISLTGQTDLSGTVVTLNDKATGNLIGTFTTLADGNYGFWVIAGHYTITATHTGPPAFTPKTADVVLVNINVPIVTNATL